MLEIKFYKNITGKPIRYNSRFLVYKAHLKGILALRIKFIKDSTIVLLEQILEDIRKRIPDEVRIQL